ncbi:hypothetical protein ACFHWS_26070 [Micromonospora sp. LOL_013]|uniref:hypothetical protein n=1 Tax=Micromonospora sp. LOL_013 TaxID=3345414 RepID=UPI003A8480DC
MLRDPRLILLRGDLGTPAGLQSVDVARRQHGPDQRRSARTVAYWLRQYRRLADVSLDGPAPPATPRLHRGTLVSSAAATAARMVPARHRVSFSTVLLAATTALSAGANGRQVCGQFNMSHSRFRPEYVNAIANLGQIGFCVLDIADRPGFFELLPRIYRVALDGYLHAYYDAVAMRTTFEELGYDYTTAFLPHYYFNDVRLPGGDLVDDVPPVAEQQLRATADGSHFTLIDGLDAASWHRLLHVVDEPEALGLTYTVDTRSLRRRRSSRTCVTWRRCSSRPRTGTCPGPGSPADAAEPTGAQYPGRRAVRRRGTADLEPTRHLAGPGCLRRCPGDAHLPRTLRVPDRCDTDVERLSRAVGLLVEWHAALRTGFQPAGDDLARWSRPPARCRYACSPHRRRGPTPTARGPRRNWPPTRWTTVTSAP